MLTRVRPGASVLYARARRASLVRALRTGGTGQLVPNGTYTVRVSASGVPYAPRTVPSQETDGIFEAVGGRNQEFLKPSTTAQVAAVPSST